MLLWKLHLFAEVPGDPCHWGKHCLSCGHCPERGLLPTRTQLCGSLRATCPRTKLATKSWSPTQLLASKPTCRDRLAPSSTSRSLACKPWQRKQLAALPRCCRAKLAAEPSDDGSPVAPSRRPKPDGCCALLASTVRSKRCMATTPSCDGPRMAVAVACPAPSASSLRGPWMVSRHGKWLARRTTRPGALNCGEGVAQCGATEAITSASSGC